MRSISQFKSKIFLVLAFKERLLCSSFPTASSHYNSIRRFHNSIISASSSWSFINQIQPERKHNLLHQTHQYTKLTMTNTDTNTQPDMYTSHNPNNDDEQHIIFGKFKIQPSQIFYQSPSNLSAAIVNLRPIVPGHVLIIPKRIIPKISQLETDEYIDLWQTVRLVQNMLEKHYNANGFNIAIQDGKAAGQSVPHVHVHILPRNTNDFERNDEIYDKLEEWGPTDELVSMKLEEKEKSGSGLHVPDDEDRKNRTLKDMEVEALVYRRLLGL